MTVTARRIIVLVVTGALAGCAAAPTVELQRARGEYQAAARDPHIPSDAPVALPRGSTTRARCRAPSERKGDGAGKGVELGGGWLVQK